MRHLGGKVKVKPKIRENKKSCKNCYCQTSRWAACLETMVDTLPWRSHRQSRAQPSWTHTWKSIGWWDSHKTHQKCIFGRQAGPPGVTTISILSVMSTQLHCAGRDWRLRSRVKRTAREATGKDKVYHKRVKIMNLHFLWGAHTAHPLTLKGSQGGLERG